jgi:predicted RecB family endonuclease
VPAPKAFLHALADRLVHFVKLRQAQRGDEGTDQALAGQVHTLAKHAPEHRKTDALPGCVEALQPRVARWPRPSAAPASTQARLASAAARRRSAISM